MSKHEVYRFHENYGNSNFLLRSSYGPSIIFYQKNQDFQNLLQFQIFILDSILHIIFNCVYLSVYFFIQKKILV